MENQTNKVLIVEDSRVFLKLIKKQIKAELGFDVVTADSYDEAKRILDAESGPFLVAVLDLNLPDAPDGEIVKYVVSKGIPSIVVTALINDNIRDQIIAQDVLDYIIKEGAHSLQQLTDTIKRFVRNRQITVLVVDDSGVARKNTRRLLEKQNFRVMEAEDGLEALAVLKDNPRIRLVITDYHMAQMDGFKLTAEIRKTIPVDEIAVIGMSAVGNPVLSSQFLKTGANDFITKPYHEEEFLWRVNQNIELLDHIIRLKEAAIKDHLTGLYNRRYFFNTARNLFENAKRENLHISIGMIDIDAFKSINDAYGHDVGDEVLMQLSQTLKAGFRSSDIVARYGGEEFVVLTANMDPERYHTHFEKLRERIEKTPVRHQSAAISITISTGVTTRLENTLEEMIKKADNLLYRAKEAGGNCVILQ